MSSDLTWMLLRNSSSFLVKRNGLHMSTEPANLMNKHSFKWSGLANGRAIGIDRAENGCVLSVKTKAGKRKPSKAFAKTTLTGDFRRVAKSIIGATNGYRPDLKRAALARWTKIHRTIKKSKK